MVRCVIAVVAVLVVGTSAHADEAAEAAKLFEQGRALVERGKQAEACTLFDRSYALDPQPGTALNLADCAEKDGKLREAWRLYDLASREYEALNKLVQAKFARDRAAAIAPRLAIVIVKVADPALPGLVVKIGGREMPLGPEIVERLDAGTIEVTVTAPGKQPYATTAEGVVGQHAVIVVPPLVEAAAVVEPAPRTERGRRQQGRVRLAFVVGGVGGLAMITSGVLGFTAKNIYDSAFESGQCTRDTDPPSCSSKAGYDTVHRAFRRADVGTGFAVGGVVLLAAGAVLYVTAPRESLTVTPSAGPSAAGISISGTF